MIDIKTKRERTSIKLITEQLRSFNLLFSLSIQKHLPIWKNRIFQIKYKV